MITLTALNHLRCSIRPELIADVTSGAPTAIVLTSGVRLEVRESAEEVQRLLARSRTDSRAITGIRHGATR
jgi:uncharacterized protein YlzI (FlbEa/FlbD family)